MLRLSSRTGLIFRRQLECLRVTQRQAQFSTSHNMRILSGSTKPPMISSEVAAAPFKKSTFRTKVRNPMVPLLILVSLISSALIKVASYQQEYETLKRAGETKKSVLQTIITRLENGEEFDVQKEIESLYASDADKSLEELMKEIEQAESEWMVTNPQEDTEHLSTTPTSTQVESVLPSTQSFKPSAEAPIESVKPSATSKFL